MSQYLTFALGSEHYAVDILAVQEIKAWSPITPLPNAAAALRGVMNLRGTIVPVVDLRTIFSLPPSESSPQRVIVVLAWNGKVTGAIVDAVDDVVVVPPEDVQLATEVGGAADGFITGVARNGERLVALLDIGRVLGAAAGSPG